MPLDSMGPHGCKNAGLVGRRAGASCSASLIWSSQLRACAAALWADLRRQRRTGTASIAANLAAKTTLRCQEPVLADMLFTLPPDAYYRLVHEEGWPAGKFQHWLADLLQRTCLP